MTASPVSGVGTGSKVLQVLHPHAMEYMALEYHTV